MITITSALNSLNVTGKYKGLRYTAFALKLILEDEDWLSNLQRNLYPRIADHCHCTAKSAESAIRYCSSRAWTLHRDRLKAMTKVPLYKAPSNKEFLTILYNFIVRS